jgi:hypothetical protein
MEITEETNVRVSCHRPTDRPNDFPLSHTAGFTTELVSTQQRAIARFSRCDVLSGMKPHHSTNIEVTTGQQSQNVKATDRNISTNISIVN